MKSCFIAFLLISFADRSGLDIKYPVKRCLRLAACRIAQSLVKLIQNRFCLHKMGETSIREAVVDL